MKTVLLSRKYIALFIIVFILILTSIIMFNFFQKSRVIETRDFSCPDMPDFTFKYPVFKGWEVQGIKNTPEGCYIELDDKVLKEGHVNTETTPAILVTVRPIIFNPDPGDHVPPSLAARSNIKNSHNIYYEDLTKEQSAVLFYPPPSNTSHEEIKVQVQSVGKDFPRDQFFKTVIESFKLQ